jgi:hypothetical protein
MRLFKFLVGTFVELVWTLIVAVVTLLVAVGLIGLIYNLAS